MCSLDRYFSFPSSFAYVVFSSFRRHLMRAPEKADLCRTSDCHLALVPGRPNDRVNARKCLHMRASHAKEGFTRVCSV